MGKPHQVGTTNEFTDDMAYGSLGAGTDDERSPLQLYITCICCGKPPDRQDKWAMMEKDE